MNVLKRESRRMKIKSRNIKRKGGAFLALLYMITNSLSVNAGKLNDTKLVTGTTDLINDATTILLILAPSVGIVLGVYFFIRKNAADDQDQKIWDRRIKTDMYCVIGATVFSAILKVVLTYY